MCCYGVGCPGGGGGGGSEKAVDVSRLDFRIGRILKAWKHPDADTLYVEEGERGCAVSKTCTPHTGVMSKFAIKGLVVHLISF